MHQCIEEEDLMEIAKLSFPSKDRILSFLKGASGGIEPHTLGTGFDHLPDHADRRFQACHEGLFRLREIDRTGLTFVNDTATMILCGVGRMISNVSRVAYRALAS